MKKSLIIIVAAVLLSGALTLVQFQERKALVFATENGEVTELNEQGTPVSSEPITKTPTAQTTAEPATTGNDAASSNEEVPVWDGACR